MSLISDPQARREAAVAKRARVMAFLATEKWATLNILRRVVGGEGLARQIAHRCLMGLERDGLVKRQSIKVAGEVGVTLWAITPMGLALTPEADPLGTTLEPSKIGLNAVPHQGLLQAARLQAEAAGWTGWIRGEAMDDMPTRPDAIVTRFDGRRFAVEIERTIKSYRRYQQIIDAHLTAVRAGKWAGVYYLTPDHIEPGLRRVFGALQQLTGGRLFDEAARKRFRIMRLSDWPPGSPASTLMTEEDGHGDEQR